MPKHQRDRQTTGPCPGIAALTGMPKNYWLQLYPQWKQLEFKDILDSDLHSLQA